MHPSKAGRGIGIELIAEEALSLEVLINPLRANIGCGSSFMGD
jgi:hypothetical protein